MCSSSCSIRSTACALTTSSRCSASVSVPIVAVSPDTVARTSDIAVARWERSAGSLGSCHGHLAFREVLGDGLLGLLGVGQPLLEFGELAHRPNTGRLKVGALLGEAPPLLLCGAGVLPEPAEMLGRGRDRRVRLVERRQRLLGGILSGGLLS